MQKNAPNRFLITTATVARILGISKRTFERRVVKHEYDVLYVKKEGFAWKYDLYDVFRYAYPGVDAEGIARLVYQFRADEVKRRGKKK
jgi:hypothetical protein